MLSLIDRHHGQLFLVEQGRLYWCVDVLRCVSKCGLLPLNVIEPELGLLNLALPDFRGGLGLLLGWLVLVVQAQYFLVVVLV